MPDHCAQLDLYGVKLGVVSNHPQLISWGLQAIQLPESTAGPVDNPDLWIRLESHDPGTGQCLVSCGDQVLFGSSGWQDLFSGLRSRAHMLVAEHSPYLFIHAGAAQYQQQLILLPGKSCCGKSTLVKELIRRGGVYFSDEYVVVSSPEAVVFPFRRSMSIRDPITQEVTLEQPVCPDVVPETRGLQIYFLEYAAEANLEWTHISPAQATLGLFQNTLAARQWGDRALKLLARLVVEADCWRGQRRDAMQAASKILSHRLD